jgi:hypothetical protein
MKDNHYGPLAFLIGTWSNGDACIGENRAPDPERNVENTNFRQESTFEPIGQVENHEQSIYALKYNTVAWEEGDDESFHEETGYWLWDAESQQVMKCFAIPRGISVLAGGTAGIDSDRFKLTAVLGSETYGICSNKFLDKEFKTIRYDVEILKIDDNAFSYSEDSQIKIKGREEIFHHTEKNTLHRVP